MEHSESADTRHTWREETCPAGGSCDDFGLCGLSKPANAGAMGEGPVMASDEKAYGQVKQQPNDRSIEDGRSASIGRRMSAEERQKVLYDFNSTVRAIRDDSVIQDLFEEQVKRAGIALALVHDETTMTYGDLNRRANQIARFLRDRGVGPDRPVGLCYERCPEMIVALIGILKAGGAFVPLDPSYPDQRLSYILADASPSLILAQEHLRVRLPSTAEVISLDAARSEIIREEDADLDPVRIGLTSQHLAYIIYTSGSTGLPKGVAAEHRGLVNRIAVQRWIAPFAEDDVCCQKTSIGFVDSIFEILGPLCYGSMLVLAPQSASRDIVQLARLIKSKRVTRLISVPSLAQALLASTEAIECLRELRGWTVSGEELREDLLARLQSAFPRCCFVNLYGSSEVAADATWYSAHDFNGGRVPIGRPIPNTQVYVLDADLQPVPVGATGEIHVGGIGVARGYLNRPELTAERFLPDPFGADRKGRIYKTGDLGRWRPDGTIEYVGRNDEQVKIRGARIELREIEAQLVRHPDVTDAVVLARQDDPVETRLVGYVIAKERATVPNAESLREHLKAVLPEYMLPSAFVPLEAFPLTPSGKVDRRLLPVPDQSSYTQRKYEAPRGELEEALARIWQDLLRAERVGRNDDFFERGGHSLLIVQMLVRLRQVATVPQVFALEPSDLLSAPSLSSFAALIERKLAAPPSKPKLTHLQRCADMWVPISSQQEPYWLMAQFQNGLCHEKTSWACRLEGEIHVGTLEAALRTVLARHGIMASKFSLDTPRRCQSVQNNAILQQVELLSLDSDDPCLRQQLHRINSAPFNLTTGPLYGFTLLTAKDSRAAAILVIEVSDTIFDQWSLKIFVDELSAVLCSLVAVQSLPAIDYTDYAFWERSWRTSHYLEPHKKYWLKQLAGSAFEPPALEKNATSSARTQRLRSTEIRVDDRVRREIGCTHFHFLLAVYALMLARLSGKTELLIATLVANRDEPELLQVIGGFAEVILVPIHVTSNMTFRDLVKETRAGVIEALGRKELRFFELLRLIPVKQRTRLIEVPFLNFYDYGEPELRWTGVSSYPLVSQEDFDAPGRSGQPHPAMYLGVRRTVHANDSFAVSLSINCKYFGTQTPGEGSLDRYKRLTQACTAAPDQLLGHLCDAVVPLS